MYSFSDQIIALLSSGDRPVMLQPVIIAGAVLPLFFVLARSKKIAAQSPQLPQNAAPPAISRRMMAAQTAIQHLYPDMIDLLNDEVYAFSTNKFVLRYLNKRALASANWQLDEALGKPMADLSDTFDEQAFRSQAARLLHSDDASVLFETEFRGKAFEVNLQLESRLHGTPSFIAVFRDISNRKRAEQEMAEFVATVSHEIRSPMTSIKGALNLISSGVAGPMSDRAETMIDMAQRNVERLLRLINDVLDLQKLDADMLDLSLAPIDLNAFSQEVVAANSGLTHEFGVELCCAGPQSPIYANLNRDGMMQAMTNLLSNAVKFSREGDCVELVVSEQPNGARLAVTDHGPGIPPEAHRRLFARFVQAHAQIDRQRVGTGLGLSIAKAIVEKHGGRIGFTSELGEGSTFYIDLPQADGGAALGQ